MGGGRGGAIDLYAGLVMLGFGFVFVFLYFFISQVPRGCFFLRFE